MSRIRIPSRSWILVCDGAKALLFQNIGNAQALSLKAVEVRLEPHPPTRDLGSDRPGRSFNSKSGSASALENTDWHDAAESDFLRGLALRLDGLLLAKEVANLFVVAPPKVLGILRQHLTPAVRQVLSAEIPKDFVKLPTIEIERRLSAMA